MFETTDDMGIYDTPSWILDFDPKSSLRDLKIQMITTDDVKFSVSAPNMEVHENELDFLKIACPNDVITGSFALNLYGLINRSCNDIDVLIKDKDRYPNGHYYNDHSYSGDVDFSENRLGYKQHVYRKEVTIKNPFLNSLLYSFTIAINYLIKVFGNEYNYKVDYFLDNDVRFNTFEYKGHTYKIHCPLQIMDQKLDMYLKNTNSNRYPGSPYGDKHKKDLFCIFKNIYFEQSKTRGKSQTILL
jgi:hypothetical protein